MPWVKLKGTSDDFVGSDENIALVEAAHDELLKHYAHANPESGVPEGTYLVRNAISTAIKLDGKAKAKRILEVLRHDYGWIVGDGREPRAEDVEMVDVSALLAEACAMWSHGPADAEEAHTERMTRAVNDAFVEQYGLRQEDCG